MNTFACLTCPTFYKFVPEESDLFAQVQEKNAKDSADGTDHSLYSSAGSLNTASNDEDDE